MKITIDENDKITVELDNGHVQVFPKDWQEDVVKAAVEQTKADAWEIRCHELEQEVRELNDDKADMARAIEYYHEQLQKMKGELKEAQDALSDERQSRFVAQQNWGWKVEEIKELQERIREQDMTIAKYDEENRQLKARMGE